MKKALIIIALLLITGLVFSQKQNNIWYFGDSAGINFNTPSPTALTNSSMRSYESAASISDANGNLLFYTNGGKLLTAFGMFHGGVWNKNNELMPNGLLDSSGGCNSSWQGTLIVPDAESANKYYIFTSDCQENAMIGGFRYSKVDMSLDGGLGDVTQKGIKLLDSVAEPICGIKHKNNNDFWVLVHKLYNTDFYAYLVNSNGIQAPVISSVGDPVYVNACSFMATVDGSKIGIGATYKTMLFSFDPATGLVSNYIDLNKTSGGSVFSANCRYYYTASNDPPDSKVYQFDLTSANIPASATEIHSISSPYRPMQLAPNGKIYIPDSDFNSTDLDVIENPDAAGTLCNYMPDAFNLAGKITKASLPNLISGLYGGCGFASNIGSFNTNNLQLLSFSPNPFSSTTTISFNNSDNKKCSINIYNYMGILVDQISNIYSSEIIYDRKKLSKGIYIVEILKENYSQNFGKFLVE